MVARPHDEPEYLLQALLRARRFEETLLRHANEIDGHFHVGIGLEATPAALARQWQPGDLITTTYRNHAHLAALGTDPAVMYAEIFGRDMGLQRGRAGGTHLADPEHGVLHTSAMVSGNVPIALGLAYGLTRSSPGSVAFCFFGDGAFGEGGVHESLNLASLWKLPVVFVCENNAGALDGQANTFQSAESLLAIAEVHRVPGATVDARDPFAVAEVLGTLTADVRAGKGPRFLDARSAAWAGNSTFFPHDATGPTDLHDAERAFDDDVWRAADDPVLVETRRLLATGVELDRLLDLDRRIAAEVAAAADRAIAAPLPPPEVAAMDVVS